MITNLPNRVAHTSLPKNQGLMPLYEAVINSIHALEEGGLPVGNGRITIRILRIPGDQPDIFEQKSGRGRESTRHIQGFEIVDNGIGFNDANFTSFNTLDSDYKAALGCFGVGRMLWLKAFQNVIVESTYLDETGSLQQRKFSFDAKAGITESPSINGQGTKIDSPITKITLNGFIETYRDASKKTADGIARGLFEHCLWYFLRPGGAPKIFILDDDEVVNLDSIYEESMHSSATTSKIQIKGENFELTHIKLKTSSTDTHTIAYCASSRLVKQEPIKEKISGLYGRISDSDGEFVYAGYVTSPFLDKHVKSDRFEFDISEEQTGVFEENEITFKDIRFHVHENVTEYLKKYLEANKLRSLERIEQFVAHDAPRYKPVLKYVAQNGISIDPESTDKKLESVLHEQYSRLEREILEEGKDILKPIENESLPNYHSRLSEYLTKIKDLKQADLAAYVWHRKTIIEFLEKAIEKGSDGKYIREALIHELIMPMNSDSSELLSDNMNLWLIDESLAFHDYMSSAKTLKAIPVTSREDTKEPDILGLSVYDNPMLTAEGMKLPLASITVIELKRPMRNDAQEGEEKDPIEQAMGYLKRIRNGEVMTKSGRLIPKSEDIPGFCYIICDLTPSIIERCEMKNLKVTYDKMGYFGYNDNIKAYIEVISFDRLVNNAKQRNRAFFDKLGLPS